MVLDLCANMENSLLSEGGFKFPVIWFSPSALRIHSHACTCKPWCFQIVWEWIQWGVLWIHQSSVETDEASECQVLCRALEGAAKISQHACPGHSRRGEGELETGVTGAAQRWAWEWEVLPYLAWGGTMSPWSGDPTHPGSWKVREHPSREGCEDEKARRHEPSCTVRQLQAWAWLGWA